MIGTSFKFSDIRVPKSRGRGRTARAGSLSSYVRTSTSRRRRTPSGLPLPVSQKQVPSKTEHGLIHLALRDLFSQKDDSCEIQASYFEVYNESIYDLLNEEDLDKPLVLYEDGDQFKVRGIRSAHVNSLTDCLTVMKGGEQNRHYACTKMNHQSSRSHTVLSLKIVHRISDSLEQESLLNFIDLAGSESISIHDRKDDNSPQSTKDRKQEGTNINKSLFYLTQVISKLSLNSSQHIPYRNSTLTKILRSSLGGNSKTAVILCMTPSDAQLDQSISTLRFG